MNRKPALVVLEGYKISKVACGSSHSIAWATTDKSVPTTHEPVLFSTSRDALGATLLGKGYFASYIYRFAYFGFVLGLLLEKYKVLQISSNAMVNLLTRIICP